MSQHSKRKKRRKLEQAEKEARGLVYEQASSSGGERENEEVGGESCPQGPEERRRLERTEEDLRDYEAALAYESGGLYIPFVGYVNDGRFTEKEWEEFLSREAVGYRIGPPEVQRHARRG